MNDKPLFFEKVRQKASERWDQLEQDPELAGPWHQLFKQVQSPRHILSELLQNADDAGATEASVSIKDGSFNFIHNGEDFTEEHFASLCRFGYSNKRALHTIGFRGIGFKSIFSLGETVELFTPSLSVSFDKRRFTEPKWLDSIDHCGDQTLIRVDIHDEYRKREVEKNLLEWLKSPLSLLFFKHIRDLRIDDHEIRWNSRGPGPVPETEWMTLNNSHDNAFLLARSLPEPFPANALDEIKQERLLGIDQAADFPPCKVEIVLGGEGHLYVVLPTGVETFLPFSCNAPFIQDPARLKIKDPEISPTNRWLLSRAGELAAHVMLKWLEKTSINTTERSRAYGFFPDANRGDSSLKGACATIVEEAFKAAIRNKSFLLTSAGELMPAAQSVVIPEEMFEVWPLQAPALLDDAGRPALSRYVSMNDREKLLRSGVLEKVSRDQIFSSLQRKHLPKPANWRCLLKLWAFVAPEVTRYLCRVPKSEIRIIPVQGKNVLYSADEVVRLGEKKLLQSEKDWEFLAAHLLVLNQNWPRFMAEKRRSIEDDNNPETTADIEAAYAVLESIGLQEASDVSDVIEKFSAGFFNQKSIGLLDCVRLTQIAAKLGATVHESFCFVTQDLKLRAAKSIVLFDEEGSLEEFLPENWHLAHLLHKNYSAAFDSCTKEEWLKWIRSGRAALHLFPPFVQTQPYFWQRREIEAEIYRRGYIDRIEYRYKTNSFQIEDWDFDQNLWRYWATLSKEDGGIWNRLVEYILKQPVSFWSKTRSSLAVQIATTGNSKALTHDSLLPGWVLKLRDLPCLRDTRGFSHKPYDLLRRTPETESLMDVEPFIQGHFDTEATRPLLKLLGVRDTPTGPDHLLNRLRTLAKVENPPIHEVEKWYRRLDQMADHCSTNDFSHIRKVFWEEKIVLTADARWAAASTVFLTSDEEDVPGAAIIGAPVRDLSLWRKIGISERPTADLAIQWLKGLSSGNQLLQDDVRRIQSLLGRHATRIWFECGHWLNLSREWVPIDDLIYVLSMQSLVPWKHLHESVKQKTADLQQLPVDISSVPPFSDLPSLSSCIEERFHNHSHFPTPRKRMVWLDQFGAELCRIEAEDKVEEARLRALAEDLRETEWLVTSELETIPYIAGVPAGAPRSADVVWRNRILYVKNFPNAKLAYLVPEKLGKFFARTDITTALSYCFERAPNQITEYMEENFKLTTNSLIGQPVDPLSEDRIIHSQTGSEGLGQPSAATVHPKTFGATGDDGAIGSRAILGEIHEENSNTDASFQKDRRSLKPIKPTLIERFARNQGFERDGNDCFFHSNNEWIRRTSGNSFPWERQSSTGEVICYYLPKDHCLEEEPLQLEVDIWGLIDKFPDIYALLLSNTRGDPIEVTGARLRTLVEEGKLILYPAAYRLVLGNDKQ